MGQKDVNGNVNSYHCKPGAASIYGSKKVWECNTRLHLCGEKAMLLPNRIYMSVIYMFVCVCVCVRLWHFVAPHITHFGQQTDNGNPCMSMLLN